MTLWSRSPSAVARAPPVSPVHVSATPVFIGRSCDGYPSADLFSGRVDTSGFTPVSLGSGRLDASPWGDAPTVATPRIKKIIPVIAPTALVRTMTGDDGELLQDSSEASSGEWFAVAPFRPRRAQPGAWGVTRRGPSYSDSLGVESERLVRGNTMTRMKGVEMPPPGTEGASCSVRQRLVAAGALRG